MRQQRTSEVGAGPGTDCAAPTWLQIEQPDGKVLRRSALMLAAQNGDLALLRTLLLKATAHEVNVASPDDGATALHCGAACVRLRGCSLEIVNALLAAGGDPEQRDGEGRTPLDFLSEQQARKAEEQVRVRDSRPPNMI